MNIDFREENHEYFVDGVKKPCISDVIQGLSLSDFGAVPKHHLMEGRERGKKVHTICEYFDKDNLVMDSVDEALMGYTKAWIMFCKDYSPKWKAIEMKMYSKVMDICGTLDREGEIKGTETVVDIKTSEIVAPANKIQTATYEHMYTCMTGVKTKQRWVVKLSADGKYKIEEHRDKSDFNFAMAVVMTYRWKCANHQDKDIIYNKELYNF